MGWGHRLAHYTGSWNRYYLGFSVFLILNGFIHAYFVTLRKFDLRFNGFMEIRALLRAFPKPTEIPEPTNE